MAVTSRIVQISDNHLSARHGYSRSNWEATVAHIGALAPDLVISTGDMVIDDPDEADTRAFARERFDRLPCPWLVVPGNHDVGDGPPTPWQDQPVTAERVEAFVDTWGMDRFVHDIDGWRLVGINGLLLGSGLDALEQNQDEWLEDTLAGADGRRLAIFAHKPFYTERPDEPDTIMNVPIAARARVLRQLERHGVELIATGHLHDARVRHAAGAAHVWCPTSAFLLMDQPTDPFGGVPQVGLIEYDFDPDGVSWRTRSPAGVAAFSLADVGRQHGAVRFAPEHPW